MRLIWKFPETGLEKLLQKWPGGFRSSSMAVVGSFGPKMDQIDDKN